MADLDVDYCYNYMHCVCSLRRRDWALHMAEENLEQVLVWDE